ncbi:MAG: diphthine--ammonia ligase [Candidatus Methanomethylicaceae archaeon]|nr:diphthine--ammonia ligase [Candidatus Verstraetearchaeota archaeon]
MEKINGVALFSGKDSLYSIYLVENDYGISINYLITFITTLKIPSGHLENINVLNKIAENMEKELFIVNLSNGIDELINLLKKLKVEVLVAGDVFVDEHIEWLESICKKAGINLIEPIFGKDSLIVLKEMINVGFKTKIICVNTDYLDENWLGFIISKENLNFFLNKIGKIDPLGENGEYHTLVIDCPLYKNPINIKSWKKIRSGKYSYIVCEI